jgi:hypothetical protein
MVFAVLGISVVEATFLARVVNRSLWHVLLAVMKRLVEALVLAMELVSFGEGPATPDEEKDLLIEVTALLDEVLVTTVEET